MQKVLKILVFYFLFFSCSRENTNHTKIEKIYHDNGKLKTLTYHFKNDDIKIVGFTEKGVLDYIYNITNQGHDNFMFIFDSKGKLIIIEPHKNDQQNGKPIWFDGNGNITNNK